MRIYKLSELLGLRGAYARKFDFNISKIESKKPELKSISAEIMADLYRKSHEMEKILGFSNNDILMIEAFLAIKNQLNNQAFWDKFGNSVFFAEDGIISVNKKDVEMNLGIRNIAEHTDEFFKKELKRYILKRYHQEFSNYSINQIEEKIF